MLMLKCGKCAFVHEFFEDEELPACCTQCGCADLAPVREINTCVTQQSLAGVTLHPNSFESKLKLQDQVFLEATKDENNDTFHRGVRENG